MEEIVSNQAPAAIGPYSQAVRAGGFVFVSGQLPIDAGSGEMWDGIAEQARQSIENIAHVLAACGLTLADVVKTVVYLDDLSDFAEMNEVYATYFTEPYPVRCAFEVAALPAGAKVEIEAIAACRA